MKQGTVFCVVVTLLAVLFCLCTVVFATPWTPIDWQDNGKLRNWVRDRNGNFVDDLIESQTGQVVIVVDLNRCIGNPATSNTINYLNTLGDVTYVGKYLTFAVVTGVEVKDCYQIAKRPEVAMVELAIPLKWCDKNRQAMKVENSNVYSDNLSKLQNWPWPATLNGKGVNIAIVDSGVCDDNNQASVAPPELKSKYKFGYDVSSRPGKVTNPLGTPGKNKSHGTLMARFALGTGDWGIAPKAGLVDIKFGIDDPVADKQNKDPAYIRLLDALETVIEKRKPWKIKVVNLSLTTYPLTPPYDGNDCVSQLVNRVVAEGIVVVAAAAGPEIKPPGAASWAITVGAADSDQASPDRKYYSVVADSASGPRADNNNNEVLDEMKPEIVAPAYLTSPATARVSGLAALLLQKEPNINPGSLKDLLIRTAENRGTPTTNNKYQISYPKGKATWNEKWGYGLVDAYKAVTHLLDSPNATDLTFKGFNGETHPSTDPNLPWYYSPAIKITDKNGKIKEVIKGGDNDLWIHARVWNNGPQKAENARVNFGFYWFTAGIAVKGKWNIPRFHHIGSCLVPAIQPGEHIAKIKWVPSKHPSFEHGCIFVSIDYGYDSKFSNMSNFAQRNVQVKQASSPVTFTFRVENPLTEDVTIDLKVSTDHKNWAMKLSETSFFMIPRDCARTVQATVEPPIGVEPGTEALFFVTAYATPSGEEQAVDIGGVALKVRAGERGMSRWRGASLSCSPELVKQRLHTATRNGMDVTTQLKMMIEAGYGRREDVSGFFEFRNWLLMQIVEGPGFKSTLGELLLEELYQLDELPIEEQKERIAQLVDELENLPVSSSGEVKAPRLGDLLPEELIFQEETEEREIELEPVEGTSRYFSLSNPCNAKLSYFVLLGNSRKTIFMFCFVSAYTRGRFVVWLQSTPGQPWVKLPHHFAWTVDKIEANVTETTGCKFLCHALWIGTYKKQSSEANFSYVFKYYFVGKKGLSSRHRIWYKGKSWTWKYCDGKWQ